MSIAELERELGFGQNSIYKWKTQQPSVDKLIMIADFFDVTTDYLLGINDEILLPPAEYEFPFNEYYYEDDYREFLSELKTCGLSYYQSKSDYRKIVVFSPVDKEIIATCSIMKLVKSVPEFLTHFYQYRHAIQREYFTDFLTSFEQKSDGTSYDFLKEIDCLAANLNENKKIELIKELKERFGERS
ncbi:helix-turn-helix domain-containing protein [Listeria rocourtiae]|uniref:helix-turn-helix domain-containing protein n=1 Tax=Listeria rocourtiae TaxID=647910 RepID=UPI001FCB80CF